MGADVDLDTSSRYFIGFKPTRLLGERYFDKEKNEWCQKEYFVETSQSHVTVRPILIAQFKENQETLNFTWSWLQDQWRNGMKSFYVQFDDREIKINFESPKVIGDGKLFLLLLNLPRAYCYLCSITCESAQNFDILCQHGMVINRSLEKAYDLIDNLMKKWKIARRKKKTKKTFIAYFNAQERDFLCGFAILLRNGFDWLNLPTLHFKVHFFDMAKKLNYQMGSRKYTVSGQSVAEIEAKHGKQKIRKAKTAMEKCKNPYCKVQLEGFSKLKSHVTKKSQPKKCFQYYLESDLLEKLKSDAKCEMAFKRKVQKTSKLRGHLNTAKREFTRQIRKKLKIKVNQVKKAGRDLLPSTFLVELLLFKKVGSIRHSQNEQICHEGLRNILNMIKKNFQTFEIFI